ncbi:zf-HC2 domain-containing protein [Paenibacillus filicis]|uniref:Zf-HC2 domain-containing protein n=1 Tax=Paenibacillus gyeongsangnamensis TaxID=3388067 RepID=A0ABT4Q2S0_9BACL|nr:zf-HC2 domain-containing protein [Paenibacillus filicis]MCZ8511139.1 zf-HC2 domain-containing protein [Paenibacillus filicis]
MMCQEVIELMQRYLDRDLDEAEYGRMLEHLQQCTECMELFERLVNVSNELESLPKVTPPYSLVDAILPQLEQLGPQEAAALASEGEGAEIRDREWMSAEQPASKASGRTGKWRKQVKEWISFPVFGGVVAAGLVFGFFLFQQQQSAPSRDAGHLMSSLEASKVTKSGAAQDKAEPKAAQKQAPNTASQPQTGSAGSGAANFRAQEPAVPNVADSAASQVPAAGTGSPAIKPGAKQAPPAAKAQPQADEPAAAQPESPAQSDGDANAVKPDVSKGDAVQPLTQPVQPKSQPVKPAPQSKGSQSLMAVPDNSAPAAGDTSSGGAVDGGASASSSAAGYSSSAAASGANQTPNPAADKPGAEAAPAPDASKGNRTTMGIASITAAGQQLAAPDGTYTAVVQDGRVIVKDKQGKTVYSSKNSFGNSDQLELVSWSADYQLTYRLRLNDTSFKSFVINMKDLTETEQ